VGNEAPVEGWAGKEINRQFQIDGWGDLATATRSGEDVPERFAATFGELSVEARQRWVALGGVDEGGHQPRKRPVAAEIFEQGEEFDQVGTQ